MTTEKRYYQGTGRRKTSVARVRLFPGTGEYVVNDKAQRITSTAATWCSTPFVTRSN